MQKALIRGDQDAVKLPSFFIIGPPRTGTTWLYEVLKNHSILPSPTKETRFFDLHFQRGMKWYLGHFPRSGANQIVGEVAPTYFASARAREHIAQLVPWARIVCIFRNPVERVLSLYRLKRAYGMLRWNFEQAVLNDPELVESGRYATHLKGWQEALGKQQVLATIYDDLRCDPQAYLNNITDFIGISPIPLKADFRRTHESEHLTHPRSYILTRAANEFAEWCKAGRMDRLLAAAKRGILLKFLLRSGRRFDALSPDLAGRLYELFRPEVEELELLLQRDLSAWKSKVVNPAALQTVA